MDDKLFDMLDDLNIRDTKLLLDKDVNLSVDYITRKRIEKSIMKKTGYYSEKNIYKEKINNILGGILMKKKIALALSTGLILSFAGGGYAYAKNPVAYVSMDINPSVELGVNAFDKVVSVEAYNEDGQKILEGTNLINYNINNAVSTIISNAISDGYITQDVTTTSAVVVEITTSTDKENVGTELNEALKETADETLDNNNVDAEAETENVALARRDEARKLGITPGKLNLIQKLQELDPTINVEDYKSSSVKDIQKKAKELRKDNKSDETITDGSTSIDTSIDTSNDANVDGVTEKNTEDAVLSETSVESEEATIEKSEKNNNSSNNNGNVKKEENSNANEEKKTTTTTTEKQNNGNNENSQEKNNSSNLEKSNNSTTKSNSSNSNSSKSDNSGNSNSSSQNKGKSKQ